MNRFNLINDAVISSRDNEKMKLANDVFHKTLCKLADYDLSEAKSIVDCYEGKLKYNNYLSEKEAKEIVSRFKSGSFNGPMWSDDVLFRTVSSLGKSVEEEPFYNKWALYAVMNMYASDHNDVLSDLAEGNDSKYATISYRFADSTLKDLDRPKWVRKYFDV